MRLYREITRREEAETCENARFTYSATSALSSLFPSALVIMGNPDSNRGFVEYISNYSFKDFIKQERDAPTIERNQLWISTFLEKYHPKSSSFLIVVGMAHLEGPDNFISLLLHHIKIKGKIKRFSNEEGWKDFL